MTVRFLPFVILVFSLCTHAAEVYKWTGPDGRTHFGDRPDPGVPAEQMRIRSFSGTSDVTKNDSSAIAGVVMLSTAWCGVCKRARQYLTSKGVAFTELDVEKSAAGRDEYRRLNGRGVPIILVGNQQMNGFDPARLDRLLGIEQ
jgi:glutaredoxin